MWTKKRRRQKRTTEKYHEKRRLKNPHHFIIIIIIIIIIMNMFGASSSGGGGPPLLSRLSVVTGTTDEMTNACALLLCASVVGLVTLKLSRRTMAALSKEDNTNVGAGGGGQRKKPTSLRELKCPTTKGETAGATVITFYYGTQTGTAERYANTLVEDAQKRYGSKQVFARAIDCEDVTPDFCEEVLSSETCAVFLQSTYGDGDPTDGSADFCRWLEETATDGRMPDMLENMHFCTFGLGNRSYEHFNAAAKQVDKALTSLGGKKMMKITLGDDDKSLEEDFEEFKPALWRQLEKTFQLKAEGEEGDFDVEKHSYMVRKGEDAEKVNELTKIRERKSFEMSRGSEIPTQSKPYACPIKSCKELHTNKSDRSCVHVEFDISQCKGLTYEIGDHLGVFAENAPDVVDRVCKLLKVSKQTPMELVRREDAPKSLLPVFPGPISVGIAVARYADMLSMPRKTAIKALASFATNKKEAKELELLAVDKAKYHAYVAVPHRSLLEVMEKFPSAVPTLGAFFGCVAGRLQPRYYSISSSPKDITNGSDIVTATVAVVKHKVKTGRIHEGVCSTFLQNVREGDRVPVFVRKATFKLPKDAKAPVILIGPGTGYAPFRGFLQEREYLLKSKKDELGECMLFFGCRKEEHDYIYRDEMEKALSENVISSLNVAFSRDDPKKKVYVQDKIQMKAKDVYKILRSPNGAVYVCGDAKHMSRDVNRALLQVLQREGEYAIHEAEEIIRRLVVDKRYMKDVW